MASAAARPPAPIPIPTIMLSDNDSAATPLDLRHLDHRPDDPDQQSLLAAYDKESSMLHSDHKDDDAAAHRLASPDPADDASSAPPGMGSEYYVDTTVKYAWLGTYFMLSMMLTLYNKSLLGKFDYPWLLTFLHTSFASVGTFILSRHGHVKLTNLGSREYLALILFSGLFTVNIAVSNLSLAMVSVPFFQTIRMLCPIFTVLIFRLWYSRTYSRLTYLSLVPLILGAGMTTLGELSFTDTGFLLTVLGVILAALKTVVTNRFMTGTLALPALEFLMRMSPLAAIQALVCAFATGEVASFSRMVSAGQVGLSTDLVALFGNGFLAFLLNISSFQTNKVAGALTMTVCGNLKQSLTVGLGIVLFGVHVSYLNGLGMLVTMSGAAVYSKAELESKRRKRQAIQEDSVCRKEPA